MTITTFQKCWASPLVIAAMAFSLMNESAVFAQPLILPEGMAIPLETRQDISSKTARKGDKVELAVAKPVTLGGVTVMAAGTPAVGEVTRARGNGLLGRSGKLDIRVTSIKAGQITIPLRGQRNASGKSGTLGAVGAGIVFLPLAILVRGKNVKVPAGTIFEVYLDQEVRIPSAAPALPDTPPPTGAPMATSRIRPVDPNDALAR